MVFNNRAGQNHSTTDIIFPTLDTYFWEFQKTDGTNHYLPTKSEWTYKHPDSTISYSSDFSSAQRLPNGNTLICAAEQGYSYEVTNAKEIVWEYRTPLRYGARVKQGESVLPFENSTMKISRYAIDFPAFSGRDLTPKGFLEIPDSTDGLENSALEKNIIIFPNSATTAISIISSEMLIDLVTVYSITGKIMLELADIQSNEVNVDLSLIPPGTYYVSVNHQPAQKVVVVK
jgi:hypothetical protein